MQDYSDNDIRQAAEVREWITKQISEKQDEIDRLQVMLSLIDSLLKQGSFKPASYLQSTTTSHAIPKHKRDLSDSKSSSISIESDTESSPPLVRNDSSKKQKVEKTEYAGKEFRQLKRLKDNLSLANVVVIDEKKIEIIPLEGIILNANIPPFRTFFLNRILEGIKSKDLELLNQKKIDASEVFDYKVEEEEGNISKIIILNYRDNERLTEIVNTSAWVFTRMLEKLGR